MSDMRDSVEFLKKLRMEYLDEAMFLLEQCEESYLKLDDEANRAKELAHIFRVAHTIKGSGATVGFTELVSFAHTIEDCLSVLRAEPKHVTTDIVSLLLRCGDALKERIIALRQGETEHWDNQELTREVKDVVIAIKGSEAPIAAAPAKPVAAFGIFDDEPTAPADGPKHLANVTPIDRKDSDDHNHAKGKVGSQSIKVDAERVDQLLNVVGELVIIKSQLIVKAKRYETDADLHSVVDRLESMLRELQDRALGFRMTPLKPLFIKTQRLIRDLSLQLEKPVNFSMSGEETEIDRQVVEQLSDPLLHIVRNAMDHGVESAAKRRLAGKPESASITLSAKQMGSRVLIRISDDGGGIDCQRVLHKAINQGLVSSHEEGSRLSPKEIYDLLFLPGFSTADQVTDLSGRGVGLDVVKSSIERLKGTIQLESTPGIGTTLELSIPLASSIADGILVKVGGSSCILPMENIRDLERVSTTQISYLSDDLPVIHLSNRVMPLVELSSVFAPNKKGSILKSQSWQGMALVIEVDQKSFVLLVDEIVGQVQVVLKPMDKIFEDVVCVSGVAILGDGHVALVLAPHLLMESCLQSIKNLPVSMINMQKAA